MIASIVILPAAFVSGVQFSLLIGLLGQGDQGRRQAAWAGVQLEHRGGDLRVPGRRIRPVAAALRAGRLALGRGPSGGPRRCRLRLRPATGKTSGLGDRDRGSRDRRRRHDRLSGPDCRLAARRRGRGTHRADANTRGPQRLARLGKRGPPLGPLGGGRGRIERGHRRLGRAWRSTSTACATATPSTTWARRSCWA